MKTTSTTKTREMTAQATELAGNPTALKALNALHRSQGTAASAVELLALALQCAGTQPNLSTRFHLLHAIAVTDDIIDSVRPRLGADRSQHRNIGLLHSAVTLDAMMLLKTQQLRDYEQFLIVSAPDGDDEL